MPFRLPPLQTMSANPALERMPLTLVLQLNTVSVWCWWRTKDDAALKLVFWPEALVTATCGYKFLIETPVCDVLPAPLASDFDLCEFISKAV